jgi:IMP cyclohydrolase
MDNPNGPYPGRQLFLGLTKDKDPFFAYLVTGRSPESRERKAIVMNDVIRMGPIGNVQYDPLRHYAAVKYDNASGLLSVSNGIQTDAIFEAYRLIFNTASVTKKDYMEQLLEGAGAEPDSYHTPRIAGMISYSADKTGVISIIGMKAFKKPAKATQLDLMPGTMIGISTYKGSMDSPEAREPGDSLSEVKVGVGTAEDIAKYLFDISAAEYKGNDIRVCTAAGVCSKSRNWSIAINNIHKR